MAITHRIPTDFATLSAALAAATAGDVLLIESGHQPASGIDVTGMDAGGLRIEAEDAVVTVAAGFTGHFLAGERSRLPVLACLVDMAGLGGDGVHAEQISTVVVDPGCGVRNAGARGLYVNSCSLAHADRAVFTGAADRNVWISRASTLSAENADFSNSGGYNAVYVSRASRANIEYANVTGAANNGIAATRSWVNCTGVDVSGAGRYGILAERGAHVCADQATANGCGLDGIRATDGSFVNAKYATVQQNAAKDLSTIRGSVIHATSVTTTGGSPDVGDCSVATFNTLDSDGVIYA